MNNMAEHTIEKKVIEKDGKKYLEIKATYITHFSQEDLEEKKKETESKEKVNKDEVDKLDNYLKDLKK